MSESKKPVFSVPGSWKDTGLLPSYPNDIIDLGSQDKTESLWCQSVSNKLLKLRKSS